MNILLVLFTSVYIERCFHSITSLVILTVCKTFNSKRIFLFCLILLTPHYSYCVTTFMKTNKNKSLKYSQDALVIRQILYVKIVQV